MTPELERALTEESLLYVTTFESDGTPGTVPVWFVYQDGKVYFSTGLKTRKAQKLAVNHRVWLALGTRKGPSCGGIARLCTEKDIVGPVARALTEKYRGWWGSPTRLARTFAEAKERVLYEITLTP